MAKQKPITDEKEEEVRTICLVRIPPGDRWQRPNGSDDTIYESLTDGLNGIFADTGITDFVIAAGKGEVYIINHRPVKATPPTKYSLYGEG